jgi:Fe-S-cluster containining protein
MADISTSDPRSDLEAALRFLYRLGGQARHDVHDTALAVLALWDELTERCVLDAAALQARLERIREEELHRQRGYARVRIEADIDKYALRDLPQIDCAERLHLCRARCCTTDVTLARQDVEERIVTWEHTRPYLLRKRGDGYCVHSDPETQRCTVYPHRPAVCRVYDCRQDRRIWIDFEQRIPAVDPALSPAEAPTPPGPPPPAPRPVPAAKSSA